MKIEEAVEIVKDPQASLKYRILQYFNDHQSEVFRKRDVSTQFPEEKSKVVWDIITQLKQEEKIGRYRVTDQRFSFYGSISAIKKLEGSVRPPTIHSVKRNERK